MLQYQVRNLNNCRHNRDIPYFNTWTLVTGLSNSPFWIPNKSRFERAVDAKSWSGTLDCTTSYGYPQDLNSTKELGTKSILQILVNHWMNYYYFPRNSYLLLCNRKVKTILYITFNKLSHLTLFLLKLGFIVENVIRHYQNQFTTILWRKKKEFF